MGFINCHDYLSICFIARKRDYVEDETPAVKPADNAYSEGVTLKEDDRPARKDNDNKGDSEN